MPDQQPHTPTSKRFKRVRDLYGMATAWNSHDTRPHVVRIREKNYAEFDEMIAEVMAAAEQRGAARALREAAKDWRWSAWADAPRNPIAAANYTGDWIENRADQEGDDD